MSFLDYIKNTYDEDLSRFYAKWQHDTLPHLTGEEIILKASGAAIENIPHFLIVAYIEALLLRAVCVHDTKHFSRYHASIRFYEKFVSPQAFTKLRQPQNMFAKLAWTKSECDKITLGMREAIPLWAKMYDTLLHTNGAGKTVVSALQYDKDIVAKTENVSDEIISAIQKGLADAASELGILYAFHKPVRKK